MSGPYYSIHDLEKAAGVPMRTLRHWVNEGVIARPIGRGRTARYTDGHLVNALVVKHLRETKLSLKAIRKRTAKLSNDEMRALLPPPTRATTPEGIPTPPPEPTYPFFTWQVVTLMSGLSLMVNPERPAVRRVADEIYRYYGEKTTIT